MEWEVGGGIQRSPERSLWGGAVLPPHRDERVGGRALQWAGPGLRLSLLLESSCGQSGHDAALEEQHHDDQRQRHDDAGRHL